MERTGLSLLSKFFYPLLLVGSLACSSQGNPVAPDMEFGAPASFSQPVLTGDLSLTAKRWKTLRKLSPRLTNVGSSLAFDFGSTINKAQYYIYTNLPPGGVVNSLTVTGRIETTGTPIFDWHTETGNTCEGTPATARPFIMVNNDFSSEFGRWWSNPAAIALRDGTYTITVPFTPDRWSSVYGKFGTQAPTEFDWSLSHASQIGLTFGGGCFFGHGVFVPSGTARFVLESFQVS